MLIIEEILLEENEVDKKEKIQENLGKEVILNDDYNLWCHGILMDEEVGPKGHHSISGERYQLKIDDSRILLLSYTDLNQLLVIIPPKYKSK